ncbi:hypothetical protein AVEN_154041-1 [Araneus ventricosus]|uniref:Uncharacterized protein n=1 Tax=Araneus ventricosus TaxID=182803 RepID=A0A4Y2B4U0_ARAVE|nr:hypothetical protein AVEN_154041-1 [Araneus ventricosus]
MSKSVEWVKLADSVKVFLRNYFKYRDIVTNMESHFPAMRVLGLGREFYKDKYVMTSSSQVWSPDLGDKFRDEIWDLKGAGICSIFPLGEKIRLNVIEDSM